jgi:hypothetical protein
MKIVRSTSTLLETRLEAAAAVARLGSHAAKKKCKEFIMDIWHKSRSHSIDNLPGKCYNLMSLESTLHIALFEVDTGESINILRRLLRSDSLSLLKKEIISLFARKQKKEMLVSLKEFCKSEKQHPILRLHCIEQAHKTGNFSKQEINGYLDKVMRSKISDKVRSDAELLRNKINK